MEAIEIADLRAEEEGGVRASMEEEAKRESQSGGRFTSRKDSHPYAKASRVFFAEACLILLDVLVNIVIPLCDKYIHNPQPPPHTPHHGGYPLEDLPAKKPLQTVVLRFLFSLLKAHTAMRVRVRACRTISWLLHRYEPTFLP
eukprot:CAMPEP_0167799204 /NCGR_PEP_ID=MMETSP0111_2-20121227/16842_1 /TAXON_ID=91324 /ORGANISM="Lotharella globosa, Strain CCCM811" /LENGTH=142 /DNA_ID=CAMNT_0007693919 /DNA_START=60 /DNA_END=484 /DNA_ORIENTATION=+